MKGENGGIPSSNQEQGYAGTVAGRSFPSQEAHDQ